MSNTKSSSTYTSLHDSDSNSNKTEQNTNTNTIDPLLYAISLHTSDDLTDIVVHNLSSFGWFSRSTAREILNESMSFVIKRSQIQSDLGVSSLSIPKCYNHENFLVYVKNTSRGTLCVVTSNTYKSGIIVKMMREIQQEIDGHLSIANAKPTLDKYINLYSDLDKVDKMKSLNKDLEEVKVLMTKNIEVLLKQGESIEQLVEKSEKLSESSKTLFITSKKLNRCPGCVIV